MHPHDSSRSKSISLGSFSKLFTKKGLFWNYLPRGSIFICIAPKTGAQFNEELTCGIQLLCQKLCAMGCYSCSGTTTFGHQHRYRVGRRCCTGNGGASTHVRVLRQPFWCNTPYSFPLTSLTCSKHPPSSSSFLLPGKYFLLPSIPTCSLSLSSFIFFYLQALIHGFIWW